MSNSSRLEDIKKKLKCKKCSNIFKEPKLLPCFHIFCKSPCLEELAAQDPEGKTLTCPSCQHHVTLPDDGVAGLPTDFQVEHLFEQKEALEKAEDPKCDNCKEPKPPASEYCKDCNKLMCDKCRTLHLTWEAFKEHEVFTQEQVERDPIRVLIPAKKPRQCKKHKAELKVYCEDCSQLICSDGMIRHDKEHNCSVVGDIFEEQKRQLTFHLKPLEEKLESIEESIKSVIARDREIRDQEKNVKEALRVDTELLHRLIDERHKELTRILEKYTLEKLEELDAQKSSTEITQEKMRRCLEYAETGLGTGTQTEILSTKRSVLEHVKKIVTEFDPDTLRLKTEADIEFRHSEEAHKACTEFGEVICNSISAERSYVSGEGTKVATVATQTSVELHPVTSRREVKDQKFKLDTTLIHTKTSKPYECNYVRQENGQHMITYQTVNRGRHDLHVKINNRHIPGSPYLVAVTPSPESLRKPVKIWPTLNQPRGLAINSAGQIIVSGRNEDCVSIVSPEGESLVRFGNQGSKVKLPSGVAVDKSDNIYVVDTNNHRVQKFNKDGDFVDKAGSRGNGRGNALQFKNPVGICFNKTNDLLYVCDQENHRIQVLTTDLTLVSSIGEYGSIGGKFDCPMNLAFNSANRLYVTDKNNHRVQVFTAVGEYLGSFNEKADEEVLSDPNAIAIDSGDMVYVGDLHTVSLFTSEGRYVTSFGGSGSEDGQFKAIHSLTVDQDDSIYVADFHNKKIQVF